MQNLKGFNLFNRYLFDLISRFKVIQEKLKKYRKLLILRRAAQIPLFRFGEKLRIVIFGAATGRGG